ncbi:hypothetical protein ACFFSH_00530 [Streptomyces filamentosus]|nr:hypothetical protein [Streptomyces filamentosus]
MGQTRKTFHEGCSPARVAFAEGFRDLVNAMTSSKQRVRARQLGIPPSTLSNYWTGRRMPRLPKLRALFAAARAHSVADARVTLPRLEKLHAHALLDRSGRDLHAAIVIAGFVPEARAAEAARPSGTLPATGPAQDRRSAGNVERTEDAAMAEAAENVKAEAATGSAQSREVGEALEVLRSARAAGDLRRLVGTAWSASRTLSDTQVCEAVAGLHATGDTDLAEALLLADGQRGADATMRLALALMGAGLAGSAEIIMRASLPPEGGPEQ